MGKASQFQKQARKWFIAVPGLALLAALTAATRLAWRVRPRHTCASRFTDPQKAKALLEKNQKTSLLDGKTGKTLPVPVTKAGAMRQTTLNPEAGRLYFMLFSNPGGMVREGGRVSLLVGDFRKDGIVVGGSRVVPPALDRLEPAKGAEPPYP